jgi:hypothetical protein
MGSARAKCVRTVDCKAKSSWLLATTHCCCSAPRPTSAVAGPRSPRGDGVTEGSAMGGQEGRLGRVAEAPVAKAMADVQPAAGVHDYLAVRSRIYEACDRRG